MYSFTIYNIGSQSIDTNKNDIFGEENKHIGRVQTQHIRDNLFDQFLPKKGFSPLEANMLIVICP